MAKKQLLLMTQLLQRLASPVALLLFVVLAPSFPLPASAFSSCSPASCAAPLLRWRGASAALAMRSGPRRRDLRMLASDGQEEEEENNEAEAAAKVEEIMQKASAEAAAATAAAAAPEEEAATPTGSTAFDVKSNLDRSGAGFNQFDPVLSATTFVSRRFGLAGGLAVVGLLAATEGREILTSLLAEGPKAGTGEVVTTASGLQYEDLLIGPPTGEEPGQGKIIGFNVKVIIGDKVLFDSTNDKPVAFKFGQRPFQNVICAGLEEGLVGMRIGGKRKLTVPPELAPPGVKLPEGAALIYEVTLTEVLNNYF